MGYTFPVDREGRPRRPVRNYLNDAACWDRHHPTEPAEEYKLGLWKAKWIENHPGADPADFHPHRLTAEEYGSHLEDPRWAQVRAEFLRDYDVTAKRLEYFRVNFPVDYARWDVEQQRRVGARVYMQPDEEDEEEVDVLNGLRRLMPKPMV